MSEMHFERLTDVNDADFDFYIQLYNDSFPFHEQREAASQERIMSLNEYSFDRIYDGDEFVGLILSWEGDRFIYVEHFCIMPQKRSSGYGQRALRLLSERGKPLILEIDPPIDDISKKRKSFYERVGFCVNSYSHVHPPYHAGSDGHELVVMSLPKELTRDEYDNFSRYLNNVVMEGCGGTADPKSKKMLDKDYKKH